MGVLSDSSDWVTATGRMIEEMVRRRKDLRDWKDEARRRSAAAMSVRPSSITSDKRLFPTTGAQLRHTIAAADRPQFFRS